jgi:hypothetical protein
MISARRVSFTFIGSGVVAALLLGTSCTQDRPTEPTVTGILFAKGGGVPKVENTEPPGAPQETTLDVQVFGSGFDDGSQATLLLDGETHPYVRTNSTRFVSGTELEANITIDLEAAIDLYDVEVMTRKGKKGIGVDLFMVVKKGETVPGRPTPDWVTIRTRTSLRDADDDGLRSDGEGWYTHAVPDKLSGGGIIKENGNFLIMLTDTPRWFTVDLSDIVGSIGGPPGSEPDFYVPPDYTGLQKAYFSTGSPSIEGGFLGLVPGETMTTRLGFVWGGHDQDPGTKFEFNYVLRFGIECDMQTPADNRVLVSAFDDDGNLEVDRWVVETAGEGEAILCRFPARGRGYSGEVGRFNTPFQLTLCPETRTDGECM